LCIVQWKLDISCKISSNWMEIYTIKFKLMKFKSGNITNYTLKHDFKSEII
jgi:hypothetical protein